MKKLPDIFEKNARWAQQMREEDPQFFERLSSLQRPKYLWIGCSDSRVPANQITGLLPGEVFVHRNVGNIVSSTDLNLLSVLQYAVEVLEVQHVIVCGHYGCGAVQAAMENRKLGLIDYWLETIRNIQESHDQDLHTLPSTEEQLNRLCELNVIEQAKSVCRTGIVHDAWDSGRKLTIHGWIYSLRSGRLKDLGFCVSSPKELTY